jgi:tetratricopeptide (TPR) repeat protein
MITAIMAKIILIILLFFSFGFGNGHAIAKENLYATTFEYSTRDESLTLVPIHHGTTLDHDYFTASQNFEIKDLLHKVEKFHLNDEVLANISSGKYIYALKDIKYTLERFPNHPKALQLIGSTAKLINSFSLAIPYYEKALYLFPQYAITHAQYGSYLVDIGRIEVGISKLKHALELDPKLSAAYAWLAKAYFETGNLDLARQAVARARELGYKGNLPNEMHGKKAN